MSEVFCVAAALVTTPGAAAGQLVLTGAVAGVAHISAEVLF